MNGSSLMQALSMVRNPNQADVASIPPMGPLHQAMTAQQAGEAARNVATRLPAYPGFLVDALTSALLGTGMYDQPSVMEGVPDARPQLRDFPGTTDWIQQSYGGDPDAPISIAADFLSPDWMDAARVSSHLPDAIGAMTVFHGSPHKWDKVDLSKVGTGEGAQAYGHGFYVAENSGVAESYRRVGMGENAKIDGKSVYAISPTQTGKRAERGSIEELAAYLDSYGTRDAARTALKGRRDDLLKLHDEMESAGRITYPESHLYELDLPDETIGKMLDWDKPLSEQAPEVMEVIRQKVGERGFPLDDPRAWGFKNPNKVTGRDVYNILARGTPAKPGPGEAGASKLLSEAGIPGIKYLDGTSRSAGEGTRNFVIFDEQYIKPLKRNGESLQAALNEQSRNP